MMIRLLDDWITAKGGNKTKNFTMGGKVAKPAQELAGSENIENIEASAEGAGIVASQERAVDSRVRIEGLTTQPELNGLEGTVKKLLKNDRLWVKLVSVCEGCVFILVCLTPPLFFLFCDDSRSMQDTGQELNVGVAKTVLLSKIDNAPTARPGAQPFPANKQGQTKSQEEVEVEADEKRRIWEELARQRQEEKKRAGPFACEQNNSNLVRIERTTYVHIFCHTHF
jgi:hypothetical protein